MMNRPEAMASMMKYLGHTAPSLWNNSTLIRPGERELGEVDEGNSEERKGRDKREKEGLATAQLSS